MVPYSLAPVCQFIEYKIVQVSDISSLGTSSLSGSQKTSLIGR